MSRPAYGAVARKPSTVRLTLPVSGTMIQNIVGGQPPRIVQNLCVPSEPEMVTIPIAWLAGPIETVLTPAIVIDPLLVVPDVPMFDITVSVSESGLKCQSKPLVSDMIRSEGHEFQPRLAFWS